MIAFAETVSKISSISYALDALGVAGAIIGLYVASKSAYSKNVQKDAAELINIQHKLNESLKSDNLMLKSELHEARKDIEAVRVQLNDLQGQLTVYKELQMVQPDVIEKILETQHIIVNAITKSQENVVKSIGATNG